MSRCSPMDLQQTNGSCVAIAGNNNHYYSRGFNNASMATNSLMTDTTWI